jgi:type IV pilus assembly protein PilB
LFTPAAINPAKVEIKGDIEVSSNYDKSHNASSAAPPIIHLANKVICDAVSANASDIHLVPKDQELEINFRIDCVLSTYHLFPNSIQAALITRLKLLAGMDISERRKPQDGRFRAKLREESFRDIRMSVVPTPFGESAVLRLLRSEREGVSFNDLGLSEEIEAQFCEVLSGTEQMVIVTGPTGSGKTTTLYAALQYLNAQKKKITTVEDPIEFRVPGITQIQVDHKLGITSESGLRSILRQDPDVILVGEIRDCETAETAFHAAQTGHLVLSTLHTNDAPSVVTRLIDLGLEPFVIADSLRAVIAQRLLRKICSHCSQSVTPAEATQISNRFNLNGDFKRGIGCDKCDSTGYKGRTAVYSFFVLTENIRELVRKGASLKKLTDEAAVCGMRSLAQQALYLVQHGETSIEEAERVIGYELKSLNKHSTKTTEVEIPHQSIAELAEEVSTPNPQSKIKVLIIDDDSGVRAVISRALRKANFEVLESRDGKEALHFADGFLPDIILSDLNMPELSGREVITTIRSHQKLSKIPILILTGTDEEDTEIDIIQLGANDFISKKSSPNLVLARINRLLSRASA